MSSAANEYRGLARYYDLDPRPIVHDDIAFYVDEARGARGPILDLGCGSGRVALPLVHAGADVWGVDHSDAMRALLTEKAATLPADERARLHVFDAPMTDFVLDARFALSLLAFRGLNALTSESARRDCLSSIAHHMKKDGRAVIHALRPRGRLGADWVSPTSRLDWTAPDPVTGRPVRRFQRRAQIDPAAQIMVIDLWYEFDDQVVARDSLVVGYQYEDQLRETIAQSGLQIERGYGYFDRRPLDEGPEFIFVCTRRSAAS